MDVASHHVVGEVRLQNDVLGVHVHLEDVIPRLHISDIDPLAVNVRIVCVVAAWTQALGKGMKSCSSEKLYLRATPRTLEAVWGVLFLCFLPDLGPYRLKLLLSHWMNEPRRRWRCHRLKEAEVDGADAARCLTEMA